MSETEIRSFSASRQIEFHQLLLGFRQKWLVDALQEALTRVDMKLLKDDLATYVPDDVQRILSAANIREERVFPTPSILELQPTLVGYYRLLLGVSQKAFYRGDTGMGHFKSMEMVGTCKPTQLSRLPAFCLSMSDSLAELVRGIIPQITQRDIGELPLLTLGSQLQGSRNVGIGKQATVDVFLAIAEIVEAFITERTDRRLTVRNSSDRVVTISLSADPDVRIQEQFDTSLRNKVAVEIKGGADVSNVHNRAGEAEKSHRKAKAQDYRDFWTIISTRGVDISKLSAESPTTTSWFDVAEVLARSGESWETFRSSIAGEVGIPL